MRPLPPYGSVKDISPLPWTGRCHSPDLPAGLGDIPPARRWSCPFAGASPLARHASRFRLDQPWTGNEGVTCMVILGAGVEASNAVTPDRGYEGHSRSELWDVASSSGIRSRCPRLATLTKNRDFVTNSAPDRSPWSRSAAPLEP